MRGEATLDQDTKGGLSEEVMFMLRSKCRYKMPCGWAEGRAGTGPKVREGFLSLRNRRNVKDLGQRREGWRESYQVSLVEE